MATGLPKFPEFELLSLKHRAIVEDRISKMQPSASEINFTEIFAWRPTRNTKICEHSGLICLDFEKAGVHYAVLLCEGCEISPAAKEMLEDYRRKGFRAEVACLTEAAAAHFRNGPAFEVKSDRAASDYVYLASDLIKLEGRKYDGKRNQISQFRKNYSHELVEINRQNIHEAESVQAEWCRAKKCEPGSILADEGVAIEQMFTNFDKLEISGAILKVNGKPAAYTLSGVLNKSTAVVYVEKGLYGYKGIYQAINQMYAEKHLNKFEFINREQDVGDDGLRHAKMSYHPHHLVEKFYVKLKS
jgi:hypothetical protein